MNIPDDLSGLLFPVADLHELPGNPRRGDVEAVKRSYERFGQRKPIVARRDDDGRAVVVAGNHQLKAVRELGWEQVAVVWADDLSEDEARGFALADNRVADLGGYDDADLLALLDSVNDTSVLAATGYTETDVKALTESIADVGGDDEEINPYSNKVEAPHYEIKGDEPPLSALCDTSTYDTLVAQIEDTGLQPDVEAFLKLAAARHIVFDYESIAEFYPHQSGVVQELMERSALVIVDYDDAIRYGFVRMAERLQAEWEADYDG